MCVPVDADSEDIAGVSHAVAADGEDPLTAQPEGGPPCCWGRGHPQRLIYYSSCSLRLMKRKSSSCKPWKLLSVNYEAVEGELCEPYGAAKEHKRRMRKLTERMQQQTEKDREFLPRAGGDADDPQLTTAVSISISKTTRLLLLICYPLLLLTSRPPPSPVPLKL